MKTLPTWSCPKKIQARNETILSQYRHHFGQQLPEDRQYWTMCGRCFDDNLQLLKGCELDQMVKESLITPEQFHGVEIDTNIHHGNEHTDKQANWYNGDFYQTMIEHYDNFRPAIVNADFIWMPDRASAYFSKVMLMLSKLNHEAMLVGNFILRNRWITVEPDEIVRQLEKESQFQSSMEQANWQSDKSIFVYNGSGSDRTVMGTIIFNRSNV